MSNNKSHSVYLKDILFRHKGINITAQQMKELDSANGNIKVFAGGNTTANIQIDDIPEKYIITKPSIIVKSRGNIDFDYYEGPFTHKNELWSYSTNSNDVNLKYIYYILKVNKYSFLNKAKANSVKLPQLTVGDTDNFEIPLPHIKVQEEIVKILDSFTNLIDALNEELSLRQKQFEYYREKLLTFDDNTNMQKICNFATIQSGKNKERTDNGQFPLFGSTGLISRTNISVYEGDYILIARVGANAGFTYRVNGKFDVSDNTLIVTIIKNNTINIDYLYHCLIEQNLNKYAKGGGQPLVTSGELKNISIPIPPLSIQQSIV